MKVLVVGSGGREHALVYKLKQECDVICAPGNPGIAEDCPIFEVKATDHSGLLELVKSESVDLVVVGPENPLIAGLADDLRKGGTLVFGPGADGARFEDSKAWSKEMMLAAGVPTAASETFDEPDKAKFYAASRFESGTQVVVKASGAALGKGVVVCSNLAEANAAIDMMMVQSGLGEAGKIVVVEERLKGREFSLLSIVSGGTFKSLPVAQDYKRALDGDLGANTGGMGSYSPVPWVTQDIVQQAEDLIVAPMVAELARQNIDYRGVLFSGIMVSDGKPFCLEYNVRFGDPETQSVVMRLGSGFANAILAAAKGEPIPDIEVLGTATVTVVIASGGYPGDIIKGRPITIGAMPSKIKVFHSGTALKDGKLVTDGGRVLAVTATTNDLQHARRLTFEGLTSIRFDSMQYRRDIGL